MEISVWYCSIKCSYWCFVVICYNNSTFHVLFHHLLCHTQTGFITEMFKWWLKNTHHVPTSVNSCFQAKVWHPVFIFHQFNPHYLIIIFLSYNLLNLMFWSASLYLFVIHFLAHIENFLLSQKSTNMENK